MVLNPSQIKNFLNEKIVLFEKGNNCLKNKKLTAYNSNDHITRKWKDPIKIFKINKSRFSR